MLIASQKLQILSINYFITITAVESDPCQFSYSSEVPVAAPGGNVLCFFELWGMIYKNGAPCVYLPLFLGAGGRQRGRGEPWGSHFFVLLVRHISNTAVTCSCRKYVLEKCICALCSRLRTRYCQSVPAPSSVLA